MALTCKNCGGNISLNMDSSKILCDSCGAEQPLSSALSDNAASSCIYITDDVSQTALDTYRRALSMMSSARTQSSFLFAAQVFEEVPELLAADALAKECREKAELLRLESIYTNAVSHMQSDDPATIENAMKAFESLGEYKDSVKNLNECIPRLNEAQKIYREKLKKAEQQKAQEEEARKKQAAKRKFLLKSLAFATVFVLVCAVIINLSVYSPSNIKITLFPDEDNFVTEKHNGYVFNYDVKIENNGLFDVSSIEGTVIFEKANEVLIDTPISFYNYSSAVVRAKKSSKFTWELTTYSEDTALELYETDFDDLDIKINITSITYINGKTKTY